MPRTRVAPYRANTSGSLSANMVGYYRANGDTGNARNPRQRAAVPPQPGQQVGRRDLAVYQQVGAALAARGGER